MPPDCRKTGERLVPELYSSEPDYILYLRHLFAYRFATSLIRRSDAVLDLGSGTGYGTRLLAEHARTVVGVDVEPDVVAAANATYGSEQCRFTTYGGLRLPFETAEFDAVTSFQTIEHAGDDRTFADEVRRVLRPGGTFILTTPNRLTRVPSGRRPWNRFHVREYTPAELEGLLRASFGEVTIHGIRASRAIETIEGARVAAANRLARLDPLNLRHLIPAGLIARLRRRRPETSAHDFTRLHGLDDFYADAGGAAGGMDLLAVCR
ncbi:MAG TPA: class I SAM-dependent methyltransferase [Thermoanaerobaculia bacterium]|nr:class I SAM-dependent methyltransferase [Thermoanaerobaculia bacterium]